MLLSNQKIKPWPLPAKIAANRQNAKKCRGPITPARQGRSSMNALNTGIDAKSEILPNENPADRANVAARFHLSLAPATPEEYAHVNAMIRDAQIATANWNEE